MFKIDSKTNTIYLTKGDNAEIEVKIYDNSGKQRQIYADDRLTLTVKKIDSNTKAFSVEGVDGVFSIIPEHTKSLATGFYYYDVQLDTFTGKVYTVIPKSNFIIKEEITE